PRHFKPSRAPSSSPRMIRPRTWTRGIRLIPTSRRVGMAVPSWGYSSRRLVRSRGRTSPGGRARHEPGHGRLGSRTYQKESAMVTRCASTAPRRIERHEVMDHIAILEQATRAVHEGYVGPPLYHQATHPAQRLLALVEAL